MSTMTFQFLDVGQGDGTLVQITNPAGGDFLILVDFGELRTEFQVGIQDALRFVADTVGNNSIARGRPTPFIDHLFITHPDADHYNKIGQLVDATFPGYAAGTPLQFGTITVGGVINNYAFWLRQLLHLTLANGLPVPYHYVAGPGAYVWTYGNVTIKPLSANYGLDANMNSLVLLFEIGNTGAQAKKTILCGDATTVTENWILNNYPAATLQAYGLKIGHHGSAYSSSPPWAAAVAPAAIFASADTFWKHPYCVAICRYTHLLPAPPDLRPIRFACGNGTQPYVGYYNNTVPVMVCMSMWLWTIQAGWWAQTGFGAPPEHLDASVYCGVQWSLTIDSRAAVTPVLGRSETYIPLPAPINRGGVMVSSPALGDHWDCATGRPTPMFASLAARRPPKRRSRVPVPPPFRTRKKAAAH